MGLDIKFPTAEEEFQRYQSKSAPMEFEFPEDIKNSFANIPFQPFPKPFDTAPEPEVEVPGFFKSAAHEFKEFEVLTHMVNHGYDLYQAQTSNAAPPSDGMINPLSNEVPIGWNPFTKEAIEGIDEKYFATVTNVSSPAEQSAKRNEVLAQQAEEEYYKDGSLAGKVFGGLLGVAADIPLFAMIPLAAGVKYATLGKNVVQNMVRGVPSLAANTVAYTAAMDATTTGKTMSDFVYDSAINTVAGLFLIGGGAGLGHAIRGGQMYSARQYLHMNIDGITSKQKIDESGKIIDNIAVHTPGSTAGAMQVKRAQEFLDSHYSKIGLFGLPVVGKGLEKVTGLVSPIFKGLSSGWNTVARFTNLMAEHSIETRGDTAMRARSPNFQSIMSMNHAETVRVGILSEGYRNTANGMAGNNPIDGAKRIAARMGQGGLYSKEDWGSMVMNRITSGESSMIPEVNEDAAQFDEFYKTVLYRYQKAEGLEERDLPVRTAAAYASRIYNQDVMALNEERWHTMSTNWFREGDRIIEEAEAPFKELAAQQKALQTKIHAGEDSEENRSTLALIKREKSKAKNALKERMRNEEDLQIHLDERTPLSKQEEKQLKVLLKPWNEAKKNKTKVSKKIDGQKFELLKMKDRFERPDPKGPTSEPPDRVEMKAEINELEADISKLEKESQEFERQIQAERDKLDAGAVDGTTPKVMYWEDPETGFFHFRDPKKLPKFRKRYNDHGDEKLAASQRRLASEAYYETIRGTTPDQLAEQMMNTIQSRISGAPQVMKERSFLIPDSILLDNGFLNTDMSRNASLYGMTMGRKSAFAEVFTNFSVHKSGIHGIAHELSMERKAKINAINKDLPKEKFDKAAMKIEKSFKKQEKFIANMVEIGFGKSNSSVGIQNFARGMRAYVASTRLANVTIAQIPDIAGNIIKNGGIWEFFKSGITPSITSMNGLIKSEAGKQLKSSASEALLCLEHTNNSHGEALWNYSTQSSTTFGAKAANTSESLATLAGNLSLSNALENWNQQFSANLIQSRIMTIMHKYKDGTMSNKEGRFLAIHGVEPKEWAGRFIKSFNETGGKKGPAGGYLSDYSNWADQEARVLMGKTVRKGVADTIIKRGLFDSPFISNNPIVGMLFSLTGWMFAAFNRYAIPAMQRPFDAHLFQGTIVMVGLGSLVDPLRRWSRGEEFDVTKDEQWFIHAMSNAAPFAPIFSAANLVNALTGDQFMTSLKNDRHRELTFAGQAGGPILGIAEIFYDTAKMFGSGKYNQHDYKKQMQTFPVLQQWYLSQISNSLMDSVTEGLPKTYHAATGFSGEK